MKELFLHDLSQQLLKGDRADAGVLVTHFPFVIGRHKDCDYRIDNPFISRHHCTLFLQDGQVWVQDLVSYNGTFVNQQRVERPRPLRDGDTLQLAYMPFRIDLPVGVETRPVEAGDEIKAMEMIREPQRVLVVEDNADAAETLALILKAWGHEVQVAHDGAEALQAARTQKPDTVLLDIRLPGMDGYEVAQRLRNEVGLDQAQMVGITGYQHERERPRFKEAGLNELLVKPVAPEALQEVLTRAG